MRGGTSISVFFGELLYIGKGIEAGKAVAKTDRKRLTPNCRRSLFER